MQTLRISSHSGTRRRYCRRADPFETRATHVHPHWVQRLRWRRFSRRNHQSRRQARHSKQIHRVILHSFSKRAYKGRNVIERCFCRLKDFRRVATRYDKLARNFLAAVHLAANRRGVVSGTATQMPKLANYGNRYICPTVVALAERRCARSADTCPLPRQIDRTRPDDLRHSNADSFSPGRDALASYFSKEVASRVCGALALPSNCARRSAGFTSLLKHLFARTCDKSSALSVNLPSLARQPSWTGASSS
ncbi:transposase [Bradyrhizobium sp. LM2.7]